MKDSNQRNLTFRLLGSEETISRRLYELSNESFEHGSPWTVEQFEETRAISHLFYLIAELEGELVAFLSGSIVKPEAEIYNIVVRNQYKRQGIASELIAETKKILQINEITDLFLEVRVSNRPAILLYKKMGFIPVGVRKQYYSNPQEDAVVLKSAV